MLDEKFLSEDNLDTMMDPTIEDQGEFYDNEKEGGDIRNEQSFKRSGSETETSDAEVAKKPKMEVYMSFVLFNIFFIVDLR